MLDLSRLSPEQRQAVLAGDGPLLIVAGPGSGKTTVLAARIAYLVVTRWCAPAEILALTFTTKAARELRARLHPLLGSQGEAVDVMTFHSLGLRIVREWREVLGFPSGPLVVYGEQEAHTVLETAARERGVDLDGWPLPDLARLLERYRLGGELPAEMRTPIQSLAETYEAALRERAAVDYPAMLAFPLQLFAARSDILRRAQDRYRVILVDEFQDVCRTQYALLRALAERHRNLVVVGDPLQTLFGWRGADVRLLLDFRRDFPEAQVLGLDQNFRSTGRIVDLANALSRALPYRRVLWTDNPPGVAGLLHVASDEEAEASFVAGEIERLLSRKKIDLPGEVAILYRTNHQVHELSLALRQHQLPYRVAGNGDLFARREVQDALAYLRLAHNPSDTAALFRIINVPPRGLACLVELLKQEPATEVEQLPALARAYGSTALAAARALAALVTRLHAESSRRPPVHLLDLALEETGYERWLSRQVDGPARLARLSTLRTVMQRWDGDLGSWLADLHLNEEMTCDPNDMPRVLLTNIHRAKGGEWRVVFVVGVEEGLLPHARSLVGHPGAQEGLEEELRVAYVAVTRPRERLYLTCCARRHREGRSERRHPSRFLRGLPLDRVDRSA